MSTTVEPQPAPSSPSGSTLAKVVSRRRNKKTDDSGGFSTTSRTSTDTAKSSPRQSTGLSRVGDSILDNPVLAKLKPGGGDDDTGSVGGLVAKIRKRRKRKQQEKNEKEDGSRGRSTQEKDVTDGGGLERSETGDQEESGEEGDSLLTYGSEDS